MPAKEKSHNSMTQESAEKVLFVSSADHKYFPLLLEWVHCLRRFPEAKDAHIGIMNAGMTAEQIAKLEPLVDIIITPDWPCPIAPHKVKGKDYLKACVARPWIPQLFPDYDLYFWMDCDVWMQNWHSLSMFLEGGRRKKITLTGQIDRAYPRQIRVKWLGRWPFKVRNFYFSNARQAFGFKTAQQLLPHHVLLAGAFCLYRDAPHWKRWQELVTKAVIKGKVFTAEQTSLGVLCHVEGYEYELLPAYIHWLCEFKPLWDDKTQKFVEPYLPHNEIGILHLSGVDEMRLDRSETLIFQTLDGGKIEKSYRYPFYDGALDETVLASS